MGNVSLMQFYNATRPEGDYSLGIGPAEANVPQNAGNLDGRTVKQVANPNPQACREMREALFQAATETGGTEKTFVDNLRTKLGIGETGKATDDREVKSLETRKIVNLARAQGTNVEAMLNRALTVVTMPPKAKAVLKATILSQADHPDVVKFLATYAEGRRDLHALSQVCALGTMIGKGDALGLAYLEGFSAGVTPSQPPLAEETENLEDLLRMGQEDQQRQRTEDLNLEQLENAQGEQNQPPLENGGAQGSRKVNEREQNHLDSICKTLEKFDDGHRERYMSMKTVLVTLAPELAKTVEPLMDRLSDLHLRSGEKGLSQDEYQAFQKEVKVFRQDLESLRELSHRFEENSKLMSCFEKLGKTLDGKIALLEKQEALAPEEEKLLALKKGVRAELTRLTTVLLTAPDVDKAAILPAYALLREMAALDTGTGIEKAEKTLNDLREMSFGSQDVKALDLKKRYDGFKPTLDSLEKIFEEAKQRFLDAHTDLEGARKELCLKNMKDASAPLFGRSVLPLLLMGIVTPEDIGNEIRARVERTPIPEAPPSPEEIENARVQGRVDFQDEAKADAQPPPLQKKESDPTGNIEGTQGIGKIEIPEIKTLKAFVDFLKANATKEMGVVQEDGTNTDLNGKTVKTFLWKGIMYRVDSRPPEKIKEAGGFTSRLDLNDADNLREAQGLGKKNKADNEIVSTFCVTGKSGVSCARTALHCIGYSYGISLNDQETTSWYLYVIDSRDMGGEKAWDLQETANQNGHTECSDAGKETNASKIPYNRIVGACRIPFACVDKDTSETKLEELTRQLETDPNNMVSFNADYAA